MFVLSLLSGTIRLAEGLGDHFTIQAGQDSLWSPVGLFGGHIKTAYKNIQFGSTLRLVKSKNCSFLTCFVVNLHFQLLLEKIVGENCFPQRLAQACSGIGHG